MHTVDNTAGRVASREPRDKGGITKRTFVE
jgi:hypothetical protein